MEYEEVVPKKFPSNLLKKDWSKRMCQWRAPAVDFAAKVHDMEVKDDDVWIVTLPKCGTTWMQELMWLVLNDFDFEGAKSEYVLSRSPFLEFDYYLNEDLNTCLKPVENLKSPRFIKSHMPLPLLPAQLWEKKPKLVYVYRNPIDAQISLFYHLRSLGKVMNITLEEYLRDFIDRTSLKSLPFEHVTEFYALRNEPWIFYTSYERMKSNLREVILDVCKFLNKTINEEQMQQMLKHLSFEEMKKNDKTNHVREFNQLRAKSNVSNFEPHRFVRKGKVNVYKEELSEEFIRVMEKWVENNLAKYNLTLNELLLLNKQ